MKRKEAKVEMMLMEMATGRGTEPELGAGGREDSDLIFDMTRNQINDTFLFQNRVKVKVVGEVSEK